MYILRGLNLAIFLLIFSILAQSEVRKPDNASDKVHRPIEKGIKYLLKKQKNGRWYHARDDEQLHTAGVTSIVCMALLSFPDIESGRSIKAVRKALSYLLKKKIWKHDAWSLSFTLLFLRRCLDHAEFQSDQKHIKDKMRRLIKLIRRAQLRGGWGYRDLSSASFLTAMVLLALKKTQEAGFEIPERVIKKGISTLKSLRKGKGVFRYSSVRNRRKDMRVDTKKGSIGRGCICELALFRWGVTKRRDLEQTLGNFFKYRRSVLVKRLKEGKRGSHSGPYGIAPFYFFFSHYFASIVAEELGKEFKNKYHPKLTMTLLKMQSKNGYWVDSEEVGRDYGTGMALLTLARTIGRR